MPVDRAQFDADLAASHDATEGYIAAVDAFIQNQAVLDLAAEDATVNGLLADVTAAQGRIPGHTAPPTAPAQGAS